MATARKPPAQDEALDAELLALMTAAQAEAPDPDAEAATPRAAPPRPPAKGWGAKSPKK